MLTISIQNAKSPSYVTIRTTPFRWGVANRLTVVTVFPVTSLPENDTLRKDSLGETYFYPAALLPSGPAARLPFMWRRSALHASRGYGGAAPRPGPPGELFLWRKSSQKASQGRSLGNPRRPAYLPVR